MKKLFFVALLITSMSSSASNKPASSIGKNFNKLAYVVNEPTYCMFLMMDGCYHLYKLDSYIDYSGMAIQGWVRVDQSGYIGTTTICLSEETWEALC